MRALSSSVVLGALPLLGGQGLSLSMHTGWDGELNPLPLLSFCSPNQ